MRRGRSQPPCKAEVVAVRGSPFFPSDRNRNRVTTAKEKDDGKPVNDGGVKKRPKKSTKRCCTSWNVLSPSSPSLLLLPRQYDAGKIVASVFSEIVCGVSLESLTHANYRWFPPSGPDNKVRSIFFIFKKPLYLCGTFPVLKSLCFQPQNTRTLQKRRSIWVAKNFGFLLAGLNITSENV